MSSKQNCSNVCVIAHVEIRPCISSHVGNSDFCIQGYLRKTEKEAKWQETNQLKNGHTAWLLKAACASSWRLSLKLLEPLPPSATRGSGESGVLLILNPNTLIVSGLSWRCRTGSAAVYMACCKLGDMNECVLAYRKERFSSQHRGVVRDWSRLRFPDASRLREGLNRGLV
jgi:hypothetical protein